MLIWEHSTRRKACRSPSHSTPISSESRSLQQIQKEEVEATTRQSFQPCRSSAQPSHRCSAQLFCFLFGRCPFLTHGGLHNDDKCEWAAVISAHHLVHHAVLAVKHSPFKGEGGINVFKPPKSRPKIILPDTKIARGNNNHHKVVTEELGKRYPWLILEATRVAQRYHSSPSSLLLVLPYSLPVPQGNKQHVSVLISFQSEAFHLSSKYLPTAVWKTRMTNG